MKCSKKKKKEEEQELRCKIYKSNLTERFPPPQGGESTLHLTDGSEEFPSAWNPDAKSSSSSEERDGGLPWRLQLGQWKKKAR